jgi:hypothetical protein
MEHEHFWLFPQHKLTSQLTCKGCEKVLELAKCKLFTSLFKFRVLTNFYVTFKVIVSTILFYFYETAQLPNAAKMAKKPLMMAIEAACKLYAGGIPLMAPLCAKMAEKVLDMLANRIIGNPKGIDPKENCKYVKMCPDC